MLLCSASEVAATAQQRSCASFHYLLQTLPCASFHHLLQTHLPCASFHHLLQTHLPCASFHHLLQTHLPCKPNSLNSQESDIYSCFGFLQKKSPIYDMINSRPVKRRTELPTSNQQSSPAKRQKTDKTCSVSNCSVQKTRDVAPPKDQPLLNFEPMLRSESLPFDLHNITQRALRTR